MESSGDSEKPAVPVSPKRTVKLVMTKSDPSTMSCSGTLFSATGIEDPDMRVRRTEPATLLLKPGRSKYVFKSDGRGTLTLELQKPDGTGMDAPEDFESPPPGGQVHEFEVLP